MEHKKETLMDDKTEKSAKSIEESAGVFPDGRTVDGSEDAEPGTRRSDLRNDAPTREVNFQALDNGDIVDLVEHPDDPAETLLAISHDGQVQFTDKLEYKGRVLVPMPRNSPELADVRLPRGVLPCDPAAALGWLCQLIPRFVRLPADYVPIVASFVVYDWFADRLPVAVYLILVGLPGSGKTTLLELLRHLCRRAVMVSDISLAATSQLCAAISPTLLIDENDWNGSRGDLARRQQLRAGTTQHALTRRRGSIGRLFGPKVLTALEPPNDRGLSRRWIQIPMMEANDTKLLKPSDPRWFSSFDDFQKRMLQVRCDLFGSMKPAEVPGAENLRPGTRDLLASLAAPFSQFPEAQQYLLHFLSSVHDPQTHEPLSPTQNAVVAALFHLIHYEHGADLIGVGQFSELANQILMQSGERIRLEPRKVGAILTSLGFAERVRTNRGLAITLDLETCRRVHSLVEKFGNQCVSEWISTMGRGNCKLCEGSADALPSVQGDGNLTSNESSAGPGGAS
jgi:hypothetical protein